MKNFTIENETNNIMIHASAKEAEAVPNSERFGNEAALAKLAAGWPAARLVEIWNSLPGENPVRKFKDRATAVMAAQLGITETSQQLALGTPAAESPGSVSQEISPFNLGAMYVIPNMRLVNHRVDGVPASLKGSNLRSPLDLSFSFASEQTIDELAELAGMDPYEFRKHNMTDERWLGVLNAVAQAANWKPHGAGIRSNEKIVTGRGIALGTHTSSYAAAVAEIEVDRETGKILAKHMYGALDAGQTVNPALLENQISGMLVQATSRMLKEEVTFSNTNVTSLDWNSYPILRFEECPGVTPIVVQRLDQPSSGGGEEVLGPAAAAIANVLYDATGARSREYPLTPARVRAALRRK